METGHDDINEIFKELHANARKHNVTTPHNNFIHSYILISYYQTIGTYYTTLSNYHINDVYDTTNQQYSNHQHNFVYVHVVAHRHYHYFVTMQ